MLKLKVFKLLVNPQNSELLYEVDGHKFILIDHSKRNDGVEYIIKDVEHKYMFSKFEKKGNTSLLDMRKEQYPEYFI